MDPTVVSTPIEPKAINSRHIPAPMKGIKLWTKVVLVRREKVACVGTLAMVEHVEVSARDWRIVRYQPLWDFVGNCVFLSGNPLDGNSYVIFEAKPKKLSSQSVQWEFGTTTINYTKEVHSVRLKNDKFAFTLIDKGLKAPRYPEELTIGWRLERLPIREVFVCDEPSTMYKKSQHMKYMWYLLYTKYKHL